MREKRGKKSQAARLIEWIEANLILSQGHRAGELFKLLGLGKSGLCGERSGRAPSGRPCR